MRANIVYSTEQACVSIRTAWQGCGKQRSSWITFLEQTSALPFALNAAKDFANLSNGARIFVGNM